MSFDGVEVHGGEGMHVTTAFMAVLYPYTFTEEFT